MRDLINRAYMGALATYIAIDVWLFHQANTVETYLTRRGL